MQRDEELSLIREIIGLAEQKSAFLDERIGHSPISRYTSPERFEREHAMIFRRKPMIAAHSSDLQGPNSFLTKNFLGLPLLLARDSEGKIKAYLNVCRHRGAKLEREKKGCKRVFTCSYHAWSWSNDGALRSVPQEAQGFPDLPRAERALRHLPVAEAHGFIWLIANPDDGTELDINTWLSGLEANLNWLGLEDSRVAVSQDIEVKANWKVIIEGGSEAYHFRVAHKETIAPYYPDNLSSYRIFGPHYRMVLPRNSMPDLKSVPEADWRIRQDANLLYTFLPNTQLLVQQDHIVWFQYEPISEALTKVRMSSIVPSSAPDTAEMRAHWEKNQKITYTALMEDFVLGEEIQAGFASRGNPSHLFGRFEGALNRFNLIVEEMLAS